jgi:hypothetical protein
MQFVENERFTAPIRQILAGIATPATAAPSAPVLTQPGPIPEVDRAVQHRLA